MKASCIWGFQIFSVCSSGEEMLNRHMLIRHYPNTGRYQHEWIYNEYLFQGCNALIGTFKVRGTILYTLASLGCIVHYVVSRSVVSCSYLAIIHSVSKGQCGYNNIYFPFSLLFSFFPFVCHVRSKWQRTGAGVSNMYLPSMQSGGYAAGVWSCYLVDSPF